MSARPAYALGLGGSLVAGAIGFALGSTGALDPSSPPGIERSGVGRVVPPQAPAAPTTVASWFDSAIGAAEARYWEGRYDSARVIWHGALERSRRLGNARVEARVLTWLGLTAFRTGEFAEARRLGEQALALKQRMGGPELSRSYNALGLLALDEGRLSEAADLFERVLRSAPGEGDEETALKAAVNLGLVYSDLGEFARA